MIRRAVLALQIRLALQAALALALMIPAAPPARAEIPAPVCRLSTVVDQMTRMLRVRFYYLRIDAALIQEAPNLDGRTVQCGICANIVAYDMPRYGSQPVGRCEEHVFGVRAVRNGFVVRYLR
jgi:hypothetical protein